MYRISLFLDPDCSPDSITECPISRAISNAIDYRRASCIIRPCANGAPSQPHRRSSSRLLLSCRTRLHGRVHLPVVHGRLGATSLPLFRRSVASRGRKISLDRRRFPCLERLKFHAPCLTTTGLSRPCDDRCDDESLARVISHETCKLGM